MTKSYYVIRLDHETGAFELDGDMRCKVFPNGNINADGEFITSLEANDKDYAIVETACEILANVCDDLPGVDVEGW